MSLTPVRHGLPFSCQLHAPQTMRFGLANFEIYRTGIVACILLSFKFNFALSVIQNYDCVIHPVHCGVLYIVFIAREIWHLFIHAAVCGHLAYFYFGAVRINAAMSIFVRCVYPGTWTWVSSLVWNMQLYSRWCQTLRIACTVYAPSAAWESPRRCVPASTRSQTSKFVCCCRDRTNFSN